MSMARGPVTDPIDGLPPAARAAAERVLDRALQDLGALSDLEGDGEVGAFEHAFAALAGTDLALAVSSGTAALHVALLACDIGPGDEVIVSPYGWGQTVAAILAVGATPVFADIEPDSGNLDPQAVAHWIGPRTCAVLVTHIHGYPADMPRLREICQSAGLLLLADGAQALGATLGRRPVAAWADATCFSFGRGKAISTGEGGALVTDDPDRYERAVLVSQHPLRGLRDIESTDLRAAVTELGLTYRLSPLLAAIGLGQLPRLEAQLATRRRQAAVLTEHLRDLPGLALPSQDGTREATHYRYVARWLDEGTSRDALIERLAAQGIAASRGPIRRPLHHQAPFTEATDLWYPKALRPAARHPSWQAAACPVATRRCLREDLSIALDA
jgi:dTDP-4-amino-4,6-dideoxygalactose transaminase